MGPGFHGWTPLDTNWPAEKFLRFAERRFGDQGKRVWGRVGHILNKYSADDRKDSAYRFIREWKGGF